MGKIITDGKFSQTQFLFKRKLNNALSTILQKKIAIVGAGRTDTGVHASQMFAHFDVDKVLKGDYVF